MKKYDPKCITMIWQNAPYPCVETNDLLSKDLYFKVEDKFWGLGELNILLGIPKIQG